MLSRIDAFDKRAFWRSRSMVSVDVTLTCKVPTPSNLLLLMSA